MNNEAHLNEKAHITDARVEAAAGELEQLIDAVLLLRRMEAEGADEQLLGLQGGIILETLEAAVDYWTAV